MYKRQLELLSVWHGHRRDLEDQLFGLTQEDGIRQGSAGNLDVAHFHGHCVEGTGDQLGRNEYLPLSTHASSESLQRIPELYR